MTKAEKIIELLKKVDADSSIWGAAIAKVVNQDGAKDAFGLIIDLRSQARDGFETMRSILGTECLDLIMSI